MEFYPKSVLSVSYVSYVSFPLLKHNLSQMASSLEAATRKSSTHAQKKNTTRWEVTQRVTATKFIIQTQTIAILRHPMATGYCGKFWLRHRM